jgi:outer membrane protein TolC
MDPSKPLSPEEAAILAVLINPALRAQRDRIGISSAQLIQAGLLPNPQFNPIAGLVIAGPGNTNPYGIGASFDFTALITRNAKKRAAQLTLDSVRLDVAWAEWQTAEAAKSATYAVIALDREAVEAEAADRWLTDNLIIIKGAYDRHQQTVLQLSAARAASAFAHAAVLSLRQGLAAELAKLRSALGLPVGTTLQVRRDDQLPCELPAAQEQDVLNGLSDRRLDLLGLKKGYLSQEQKVRGAILAQFPKINLGLSQATDNSGVTTISLAATISLPIFDHNQGAIALQRTTRQQLYDEYVSRDYQARTDVARLFADIETLRLRIAAERSAIPELEALATNLRRAMLLGNESLITYYGQVQNLSTARIDLSRLEGQLANDWVSLELASSMLLPKPEACPEFAPTKGLQ